MLLAENSKVVTSVLSQPELVYHKGSKISYWRKKVKIFNNFPDNFMLYEDWVVAPTKELLDDIKQGTVVSSYIPNTGYA